MTDDFRQRVEAAKTKTTPISATESKKQLDEKPEILLIETRIKRTFRSTNRSTIRFLYR